MKKKLFFFEKKNQKTFASFGEPACFWIEPIAGRNLQKFFASFFLKKEDLPFSKKMAARGRQV